MKIVSLISEKEIKEKIKELAEAISADYPDGVIAIGVLKGAFVFMSELVRALSIPVYCDFVKVASYKGTESSGKLDLQLAPSIKLYKKKVLLVEDIVDTGLTVNWVRDYLLAKGVEELKICCLLDKPSRRKKEIELHYVGFVIGDKFVVGYGLDCEEEYRNLPYIGYIEDEP
jgi:hypoxanthine phosphoribosyltransferase